MVACLSIVSTQPGWLCSGWEASSVARGLRITAAYSSTDCVDGKLTIKTKVQAMTELERDIRCVGVEGRE
jgi:hypothetical protein